MEYRQVDDSLLKVITNILYKETHFYTHNIIQF